MNCILNDKDSENTKKATDRAVHLFRKYLNEKDRSDLSFSLFWLHLLPFWNLFITVHIYFVISLPFYSWFSWNFCVLHHSLDFYFDWHFTGKPPFFIIVYLNYKYYTNHRVCLHHRYLVWNTNFYILEFILLTYYKVPTVFLYLDRWLCCQDTRTVFRPSRWGNPIRVGEQEEFSCNLICIQNFW